MSINLNVNGNTAPLEAAVQAAVNRIRKTPIKITVDDKGATQPLGNMKRGADEFSKSMEAANARIIAFGASMAIINGVADAFKGMVKNIVEVEKSMADINVVMNLSVQNLDKFSGSLFKVAKETGAAFNIAAQAATEYARQGLTMEESLKRTRDALILTRLTGMDSAEAVKALTAAMNTYGSQISDTTQLVSKFAAVDVKFAVSAEDFADAIARTGQSAKSAGVHIDELIGLVTAAQQKTARGGKVIGNSFKTIFTRIGRTDTLNQLENLGIAVRDLEGNTLGAKRILTDLANTFDKLNAAQQAQIAQTVGGVFQINILKAVLSDAAKQNGILAGATQISANATDEAITKNDQLRQTMSAMATETGLAIKELSAQIGEIALAPGMEKVLNVVKSAAQGLGNLLGDGESVGGKFANGLLKGIGNIITGPGMVVIVAVFGKLFYKAAQYAKQSLSSLIGVTSESQKQKAIQSSLVALFGRSAALNQEMLRTDISRTQKEATILALLQKQVAEASMLDRIAKSSAASLYRQGYNSGLAPRRARAEGHIPNFSERSQAAKGGYAAGNIRSMNMPGQGSVIYNSAEKVKNFAGFKQPAIMPPSSSRAGKNYQQAFGEVHGFNPYAAGGYIPNFSKQKTSTAGNTSVLNAINFAHMLTPGGGAQTITSKPGKPIYGYPVGKLPSVRFNKFGISREATPRARSKNKDLAQQLHDSVEKTAVRQGQMLANSFLIGTGTTSSKEISQRIKDPATGGAGALQSVVGALFESAISAKIKQVTKKGSEQSGGVRGVASGIGGDFDLRNPSAAQKEDLQVLFGGSWARTGLADYKAQHSEGSNQSMAEKIIKEKLFRQQNMRQGKMDPALAFAGKSVIQLDRNQKRIMGPRMGARLNSYGHIPNFADPLSDAIGREKSAGVPVSQIRVGSHPALMGRSNPVGIGVTNTHDEPNGLRDVLGANGYVPNYALGGIKNIFEGFKADQNTRGGYLEEREKAAAQLRKNTAREKALEASIGKNNKMLNKSIMSKSAQSLLVKRGNDLERQLNKAKQKRIQAEQRASAVAGQARGAGMRGGFSGMGTMAMIGAPMAAGFIQQAGGGMGSQGGNQTAYNAGGALTGAASGAMPMTLIAPFFGPYAPLVVGLGAVVGGLSGWMGATDENTKALQEAAKEARQKKKAQDISQGAGFGSIMRTQLYSQLNAAKKQSMDTILKPFLEKDRQFGRTARIPRAEFEKRMKDPVERKKLEDAGIPLKASEIVKGGSAVDKLEGLINLAKGEVSAVKSKNQAMLDSRRPMTAEDLKVVEQNLDAQRSKALQSRDFNKIRAGNYSKLEGILNFVGGDESGSQSGIAKKSEKAGETAKAISDLIMFSRSLTSEEVTDGIYKGSTRSRRKTTQEIEQRAIELGLTSSKSAGQYITGGRQSGLGRQVDKVSSQAILKDTLNELINALDVADKDGNEKKFKIGGEEFNSRELREKVNQRGGQDFNISAMDSFVKEIRKNESELQKHTEGIIRQINTQKTVNAIRHRQAILDQKATFSTEKFSKNLDDLSSFLGGSATSGLKLFISQQKAASEVALKSAKIRGKVDADFKVGLINSLNTNAAVKQGFSTAFGSFDLARTNDGVLEQGSISDRPEVQLGKEILTEAFMKNTGDDKEETQKLIDKFFNSATIKDDKVSFVEAFANLDVSVLTEFLKAMPEADLAFKATLEDLIDKKTKNQELSEAEVAHLEEMFNLNKESKKLRSDVNDIMRERVAINKADLEVEKIKIDMLQKQNDLAKLKRGLDQGPGYVRAKSSLANSLSDIDKGIEPAKRTEVANMSQVRSEYTKNNVEKNLRMAASVKTRDSHEKDSIEYITANNQVESLTYELAQEGKVMAEKEKQHLQRMKDIGTEATYQKQKLTETFDHERSFTGGFRSSMDKMRDDTDQITHKLGSQMPMMLRDGLAEAMGAAINGAEDLGDVLRGVAMGFLQSIQQAMLQKAAGHVMDGIGGALGFSRGGQVPARVTNGEYVMSRGAVNKYGGSFMHGLNAGGKIPGYSSGGKPGSALAANFGGGEGYASGRRYQSQAMSGFFYSGQNMGLSEDAASTKGIIQERMRKAAEKKAKKKGLMQTLLSTALSAGLAYGAGNMFSGTGGAKLGMGRDTMRRRPASSFDFSGVKSSPVGDFSQFGNYDYNSQLGQLYNGGSVHKYASGGHISGKPGIDQIPAMLSEGEYVVRASSARQIGKPMLDRINAGKFNDGGAVTPLMDNSETGISGGNTNNINITVNMGGGKGQSDKKENSGDGGTNPADASADQDQSAALAEKVKAQVVATIMDEQRPGGLLSD